MVGQFVAKPILTSFTVNPSNKLLHLTKMCIKGYQLDSELVITMEITLKVSPCRSVFFITTQVSPKDS